MTNGMNGWRTASYCESGACVEVRADTGHAEVRDKADPDSPVLSFTPAAWRAFTEELNRS